VGYRDDGSSLETVKAVCALVAAREPIADFINAKNANGETALHAASSRGLDDVVRFLVENGADVNAKDNRQRTPLALAERSEGLEKTTQLLRSLGAKE
jgi:ankyrin repeat protein